MTVIGRAERIAPRVLGTSTPGMPRIPGVPDLPEIGSLPGSIGKLR